MTQLHLWQWHLQSMLAAAMVVIIINCTAGVDAAITIPSLVVMAAAKVPSPPPPSLPLPLTTTAIAAINDHHHRCRTVDGQWWQQSSLMATATVRADVGKGG
jgi:hypothetical protein